MFFFRMPQFLRNPRKKKKKEKPIELPRVEKKIELPPIVDPKKTQVPKTSSSIPLIKRIQSRRKLNMAIIVPIYVFFSTYNHIHKLRELTGEYYPDLDTWIPDSQEDRENEMLNLEKPRPYAPYIVEALKRAKYRPSDSLILYKNLIEKYPEDYSLYLFRARIFKNLVMPRRALIDLEKSILYKPTPEAYLQKAQIFFDLGEYEITMDIYNTLLDRFPTNIEVLYNVSKYLKFLNKPRESEYLLNKILEVQPDFFMPILDKAENLMREKKYYEAWVTYVTGLSKNPFSIACYKGLAVAYNNSTYQTTLKDRRKAPKPLCFTAMFNYMAYRLQPMDNLELLYANAVMYKFAGHPFGAKFWYDYWAIRANKEIMPIRDLTGLYRMLLFDEMNDEDRLQAQFWKFSRDYPKHVELMAMVREFMDKKIKRRTPKLINLPHKDAEYKEITDMVDTWMLPSSPAYVFDIQEDDV